METDFLERCIVKIQGVIFFILKECRFRLDIKKKKNLCYEAGDISIPENVQCNLDGSLATYSC